MDGFRSSLQTASLTYLNVKMNEIGVAQSTLNPYNNGSGLSKGLIGNGFKLAGSRWYIGAETGVASMLGGWQAGPGMVRVLGKTIGYAAGGFTDMVMEAFAGPHDLANSPTWYVLTADQVNQGLGNIGDVIDPSRMEWAFLKEYTTNFSTSLMFAAPFAAAAIVEQSYAMPGLKARK